MKIRPVAEELFQTDTQTEERTNRHNDPHRPFSHLL